MQLLKLPLLPVLVTSFALSAHAGSINYANAGTVASTVTTYATTGNGVDLYYYGSTAAYTDYIGIYDTANGYNSGPVFDNRTTAVGSEVVIGAGQINTGDQLVFYIDSPDGVFGSNAGYSADGINHGYITTYTGGTINNVSVPAGLFVGMEDENKSHSDLNYNDDDFVATGVSTTAVTPEPATIFLLGTGLLACIGVQNRRFIR